MFDSSPRIAGKNSKRQKARFMEYKMELYIFKYDCARDYAWNERNFQIKEEETKKI